MAKRSSRPFQKNLTPPALNRRKGRRYPRRNNSVPEALIEAIEEERAKLMKAHSFLECLLISLTYPPEDRREGPYFPDVAETVRDLVEEALLGLDAVSLHKAINDRKVEENAPEADGDSWPNRMETRDFLVCRDGNPVEYWSPRLVTLTTDQSIFNCREVRSTQTADGCI